MKRLLLCLAILSLLAAPAMAWEWTEGADAQAYVDTSVAYQAGCVDQYSFEAGCKSAWEMKSASEFTKFDCDANVPGCYTNCGLSLDQCKFESSSSFESFNGFATETVNAKFAVGSADMTTAAGAAVCAAGCGVNADASAYQSNVVAQNATCFDPCIGGMASAGYVGVQVVDVNVSNY